MNHDESVKSVLEQINKNKRKPVSTEFLQDCKKWTLELEKLNNTHLVKLWIIKNLLPKTICAFNCIINFRLMGSHEMNQKYVITRSTYSDKFFEFKIKFKNERNSQHHNVYILKKLIGK